MTAPGAPGEGGTHRLRVQAGRSRGSAAKPRPPQSSESPAQVQAAAQGGRGSAAVVAGPSRSSSSSQRRGQGERRWAPNATRTGRAILSGARGELRARGLRGPGRPQRRAGPRGLRSALGSAPGHGRRHKFPPLPRLWRSAGPRCPGRSAAPGWGREPRAHPGRPGWTRCEAHGSGQELLRRRSLSSRRAPGRLRSPRARQVSPPSAQGSAAAAAARKALSPAA